MRLSCFLVTQTCTRKTQLFLLIGGHNAKDMYNTDMYKEMSQVQAQAQAQAVGGGAGSNAGGGAGGGAVAVP
eukprot:COSAG06_NODE_895_length_11669_cov_5.131384_12_plen_72_part_00